MSVRSRVKRTSYVSREVKPAVTAQSLLQEGHPLYNSFVRFCRGNTPTKRQARKFLYKYPQFREYKDA